MQYGTLFALWRKIETPQGKDLAKNYWLHLEEEDIIFYQINWQRGRYVYKLYARIFFIYNYFLKIVVLCILVIIYHDIMLHFHANNSKEMLKLINLELKIMPSNIVVEENYC